MNLPARLSNMTAATRGPCKPGRFPSEPAWHSYEANKKPHDFVVESVYIIHLVQGKKLQTTAMHLYARVVLSIHPITHQLSTNHIFFDRILRTGLWTFWAGWKLQLLRASSTSTRLHSEVSVACTGVQEFRVLISLQLRVVV